MSSMIAVVFVPLVVVEILVGILGHARSIDGFEPDEGLQPPLIRDGVMQQGCDDQILP